MTQTHTIETIKDVRYYTGGGECHYQCGEPAEFVVEARTRNGAVILFAGCRDCLNSAKIYPLDNDWVDERTDQRHLA